jgi:alpha-glucuronidase
MMMESREIGVNYRTPLGLHHIMARDHHYGPGPWVTGGRPDWTSPYYHQADEKGIGFDRTGTGSNAVSQYAAPLARVYGNPGTCPETLLLWFHHLSWDYQVAPGRTLWEELCFLYDKGVEGAGNMLKTWESVQDYVDEQRFTHVRVCLQVQEREARWWRDACLLYFQQYSRRDFPRGCEAPVHTLEYYMHRQDYFVPGIYNPFPRGN